uniref:Uncharacterized protein n=1 Tax=Oryza sativa subsp. japonica TaxID=39947 RepID=Q2QYQ6_ORYSJ|nr:hypothetical protein LOC_Os12g01890 [Oryza sativa Japonica Group]
MESQEQHEDDAQHKQEQHKKHKEKERLLDFLRAAPSKTPWFSFSGAAFLTRLASLRTTNNPAASRRLPAFVRSVDWRALRAKCLAWAKHPMNAALLVWLAFVAGGVAFVFLLMTGALNSAVPDASRRRRWTEVANQMLNALFTIMCVYQHPKLCHHLALLLRWRAADVAELRALYCKNGAAGLRRERLHVAVVVLLLHATCFAQYGYCALFWFFGRDNRPDLAVNLCMALGLGFPIVAALYMVYGPLGRKIVLIPASTDDENVKSQVDEANAIAVTAQCDSNRNRAVVAKPEWAGGLFDVGDDPTVARAVAVVHVLRVRMRRRFGLPAHHWSMCGGRATAADYGKWLCCAPCALAQEVRTTNLYDVEEDVLYAKGGEEEEEEAAMAPLEREGCIVAVDAPPLPMRIEEKDYVVLDMGQ